jgi:hypothetical protein
MGLEERIENLERSGKSGRDITFNIMYVDEVVEDGIRKLVNVETPEGEAPYSNWRQLENGDRVQIRAPKDDPFGDTPQAPTCGDRADDAGDTAKRLRRSEQQKSVTASLLRFLLLRSKS